VVVTNSKSDFKKCKRHSDSNNSNKTVNNSLGRI
jgi:hypothetical protein